jgi:uncharacterized protein (DUF58 family)
MRYGSGPGGPDGLPQLSKYDFAAMATAALTYLILHQQDSAGLVTYDNAVRHLLRPSSQPSHLKQVVNVLNRGPGRGRTSLAPVLHDLAERIPRRGILMLFSDLFDEPADTLTGLQHLRHKRHEVVVFHVMDRAELEFPFREATLFRGLEQFPELLTDPRSLRDGYLEQVRQFIDEMQRGCRSMNIDYVPMPTDKSLGVVLSAYLAHRLSRK